MELDFLICGGGVAGLWLLDELRRRGDRVVLVEAGALGSGQTVASQGILHGGLKYTLTGLLTPSAVAIREMPAIWRAALAGTAEPNLSETTVRSESCALWHTQSLSSRMGMIGAKVGLRVAPQTLPHEERPALLRDVAGQVARLEEQVISPATLIRNLRDRNAEAIVPIDGPNGIEFEATSAGHVRKAVLQAPNAVDQLHFEPRHVLFTAGAGNAGLRAAVGLTTDIMQRRPLHMVLVRGDLPAFSGHCVDGAKTRVTITSDVDSAGRTVWQVGGAVSEAGVDSAPEELILHARDELNAVFPDIDLSDKEWSTYRVDRAERRMPGNKRPETIQLIDDGNVTTIWPTKLVLAPQVAREILKQYPRSSAVDDFVPEFDRETWPLPEVAAPPWESDANWYRIEGRSTIATFKAA